MTEIKVTLARAWVDSDGKEQKPDATVSVTPEQADELLFLGYARPADQKKG